MYRRSYVCILKLVARFETIFLSGTSVTEKWNELLHSGRERNIHFKQIQVRVWTKARNSWHDFMVSFCPDKQLPVCRNGPFWLVNHALMSSLKNISGWLLVVWWEVRLQSDAISRSKRALIKKKRINCERTLYDSPNSEKEVKKNEIKCGIHWFISCQLCYRYEVYAISIFQRTIEIVWLTAIYLYFRPIDLHSFGRKDRYAVSLNN